MKILVTGTKGFIGSHIAERLVQLGHHVIGIDNGITGENDNLDIEFYSSNLTEITSIPKVDAVFHVAAIARIPASYDQPQFYYQNNILSTMNLLEACRKQDIKKFIYSSSSSVVEPLNPYAHSKLMGEELCEMYSRLYGLEIQCLRYFNVYGSRMSKGSYATVLQKFKEQKLRNEPLQIYGQGKQKRDFTWVQDVVDANLLMLNESRWGIYDVGSGQNFSILEVAQCFEPESLAFVDGFVGRNETLANILPLQQRGYSPKGNVIDWIKTEFLK